jgi:hypothetical protein
MKETFHILSGTPRNAKWEDAAEGLSGARERMEQLAGEKAGQYFLLSIVTCSILAQRETFSQPKQMLEAHDQRSPAQRFFDELCSAVTPDLAPGS